MNIFKIFKSKNTAVAPLLVKPVVTSRSFVISAIRYDKMNAFGAYLSPSIKNGKGLVFLNIEGTIGACLENDINPKELIVETLMHEVGHALEQWYDIEFSENRMEEIIEEYRRKNGW